MAPRSTAKKKPAKKQQQRQEESDAVDVIEQLAVKLAQLGSRKWKLAELEAALAKAAGSLADEGVGSHIQSNLQRCAATLHERLYGSAEQQEEEEEQQQQERVQKPAKKPAKRAKRSGQEAAPAAAEEDAAPLQAVPPSLATATGYAALAADEAVGQPDARFSPAALLLARRSPAAELVRAHVRRVLPDMPAGPAAALAAARAALSICSALACEAAGPADALAAFSPALACLGDAAQQLGAAREQQQGAPVAGDNEATTVVEVRQLAGRVLASMHTALLQHRHAGRSAASSGGGYWRSNPQQPSPAAAADAACTAAAAACTMLADLRMPSGSQVETAPGGLRKRLDALATATAADLRQLAPYAASGLLLRLANLGVEEVCGSSAAVQSYLVQGYLVLYGGASKQEVAGERDYLARLVAARKAVAAARHLGEEALAARTCADACALPVNQEFVAWLRDQPPSSIVAAALDASARGLDTLSKHLAEECSERAVHGLLAAMQHSGSSGGLAPGSSAGPAAGEGAAEGLDTAMDDLLFFADKEGDATMFGRDWHMDEDEEEEEEEEEEGHVGLRLGSLPGGGEEEAERQSVDTGDD